MFRKNKIVRCHKPLAFLVLIVMFLSLFTPILSAADDSVVTSIELNPAQMISKPEATRQITAVIKDQNGEVMTCQAITWSSDNENAAKVKDGLVTAVTVGTANIKATCNGKDAICVVTVEEIRVEKIKLDNSTLKMAKESTKTLQATVYDQFGGVMNGQTITWNSEKPEVAIVDDKGLVTAKSKGTTTITISCSGISILCQVEVFDGYPTNIVIITGTTSLVSPLVEAYHNLTEKRDPHYQFGLSIISDTDLASNTAKVQQAVQNADAVLVQMTSDTRTDTIHTILSNSWEAQWKNGKAPAIFTQGCTDGFAANIVKDLPIGVNANQDDWAVLTNYINSSGSDNCERLQLFLASKYGEGDVTTSEDLTPIGSRGTFAYHPDTTGSGIFLNPEDYYNWYTSRPGYNPSAPWVGIMDYDSSYINGDHDLTTELLKSLERKGDNVVLIYTPSGKKFDSVRSFFYRDLNGDGQKEPIDTFICPMGFQFDSNTQKTTDLFKEMNVPVLTPIYSTDLKTWMNDPAGTSKDVYWNVAMPELDGRIEPVLIGGTETLDTDEETGATIKKNVAIPDRIERAAGRAANWAKLHKMENKDKKVAILYYNTDGGKDGLGCTTLNVPRSLAGVLNAMKNTHYTVDQDGALSTGGQITEDKVFKAMFDKGRNIGGWAPGELEKFAAQDGIIKISFDEYLGWYNQLPAEVRAAVEKEWGPAPGKFMVQDGQIIIPGIISGNVYLGPQPMRGWGEDPDKITHSPTLPPSHQYLAYYFWLQHEFKADAVVHFGTHGSQEWLPGKSVGLSANDWSDIVLGDMPDIYPYVVNNPGEGTQAKRRGYAVLIDYLTAAFGQTDLYGNLRDLDDLDHQYDTAVANNSPAEDIEAIKTKVKTILIDEGVGTKIGVSAGDLNQDFASALKKCEGYLADLEAEVTQLGLHTFGVAPEGDAFEAMVKAIVNYDPATRSAIENEIRNNLQNTTQEMDMFLLALNAGFIPPGLGHDSIRDPDVMPTGKNIVSFDPRKTPDKTSWEIGKKCADDLLKTYYAEHGSYPESVGVVLWAIETMRDGGQGIAMTMRLMGIEPVWDATGKVTTYKITPVQDLGRPRIDVVITASSLFRDTFSNVMTLLDKAARQLATNAADDEQNNYIKKHYETLKSEYLSQGKNADEADFLAASRVFSAMPGTQGNGLAEKMGATESWNTSADLVETYLNRASYIYGTDKNGVAVYGQAAKDTFVDVLKNVQATVHVIDSTYGALDNDDIAGDLGGLTLAAKYASGKDVDVYIANTRLGLNGTKIQTIQQFVAQELDRNLLNPVFVEAMLKEGYEGSHVLAEWLGNTFFVAASLGAVNNQEWHDLAATYIFNDAVRSQLDPYCLQSMIAWTTEAARKDMWQASKEDLTKLSNAYMQTMVDYGVVCCHHTCKNIVMNEWLAQFSTLDDSIRKQFQATLADATRKDVNIPMQNKPVSTTTSHSSSPDKVEKTTRLSDTVVNAQPEPINSEHPQQTVKQEQTAPKENKHNEATAQAHAQGAGAEELTPQEVTSAPIAVAVAGNLPAASEEQVSAQEQDTAGEQNGKTQNSKAYEITVEGKQNKASGVSMWAILGVGGVMAAVGFGILKGKMLSRK
jgi:cobaltochelatase CobN